MLKSLFASNTPATFWQCTTPFAEERWQDAIRRATPMLALPDTPADVEELLAAVLGEGRFGPDHWRLSRAKQLYYDLKPLLPRWLIRKLRQFYGTPQPQAPVRWPVDDRYARFQWQVMAHLLASTGRKQVEFVHFWPHGQQFAFVLTHDIETAEGQAFVRRVVELEADLGFRSSFNFVPERYRLDTALIENLKRLGFEVGIHGLKHDGKLFRTKQLFEQRVQAINRYLERFDAVGFRTPLTHRHPEWMQLLAVEYDLSFFDTDPFEPIPGGTLSLWPFKLGRFWELPYTLVQDHTLTEVLGETTAKIWLDKVALIRQYHGMALVNSHPDYLASPKTWRVYEELLRAMQGQDCWHALPKEVARWWGLRTDATVTRPPGAQVGRIEAQPDGIQVKLTNEYSYA